VFVFDEEDVPEEEDDKIWRERERERANYKQRPKKVLLSRADCSTN
jgi:hypothetical protein